MRFEKPNQIGVETAHPITLPTYNTNTMGIQIDPSVTNIEVVVEHT